MPNAPRSRRACAALVLLFRAGLCALPAKAEGVPASFDCAKAESAPAVINAVAWQGDIFYARVARRTLGGEGEEGGWKLENHLFGAENSLPVYQADTGLLAFDMETHKLRRIASISGGDRPYALFGDLGLLVWSTQNSCGDPFPARLEEHTSELQSLMRISYAVF